MTVMTEATTQNEKYEEAEACESCCPWSHLFNTDMRRNMIDTVYNTGMMTIIIGILLNCTLLMSTKLRSERCYRNLSNYTMAVTLRCIVRVLAVVMPFTCLIDWINHSGMTCNILGFIDTFIAVFEIESLAQVAIERLIHAMYKYKGWHVPAWHNKLFVFISVSLAALYSTIPVLGIGSYGRDFDCESCTLDIVLPKKTAHKLIVIIVFVLKSIKPTVVMVFSLNIVFWIELHKIKKDHSQNIFFTLSVCIIVLLHIVFWLPMLLVRSMVVCSQLMKSELFWSPCFVVWAITMYWLGPAISMAGFICANPRVRVKMANILNHRPIDSDEPITPLAEETNAEEEKEVKAKKTEVQETKAEESKAQDTEPQETKEQDSKPQATMAKKVN